NRLDERTMVRRNDIAQYAEMLAHQVERVHVPDTVIERGGAFDVGKQEGHTLDREAASAHYRFRWKKIAECLRRQKARTRQKATQREVRRRLFEGRMFGLSNAQSECDDPSRTGVGQSVCH